MSLSPHADFHHAAIKAGLKVATLQRSLNCPHREPDWAHEEITRIRITGAMHCAISLRRADTPQTPPNSAASPTATQRRATEAADLTGNWKQTNSLDPDAYQAATIDEDSITIN